MSYSIGIEFQLLSAVGTLMDMGSGECVAVYEKAYSHGLIDSEYPEGNSLSEGAYFHHPMDYLEAITEIIPALLSDAEVEGSEVISIAVSAANSSVLPVMDDGTPLCFFNEYNENPEALVKTNAYKADVDIVDKLNKGFASLEPDLLKKYGPVGENTLLAKVVETATTAPDVYKTADYFMESGDWIVWQLTGKPSPAKLSSAVYSYIEDEYPDIKIFTEINPELSDIFSKKILKPKNNGTLKAGTLNEFVAEAVGLSSDTIVAKAISSEYALLPGLQIAEPGMLIISKELDKPYIILSDKERVAPDLLGGFVSEVYPDLYIYQFNAKSLYSILDEIEPDSYYPSRLLAVGSSDYEEDWCYLGANRKTNIKQFTSAAVEKRLFELRKKIDALTAYGLSISSIMFADADKKLTTEAIQLISDIVKLPILASDVELKQVKGTAIAAMLAAGEENGGYESMKDAVYYLDATLLSVVAPNGEVALAYTNRYQAYLQLSEIFSRSEGLVNQGLAAGLLAAYQDEDKDELSIDDFNEIDDLSIEGDEYNTLEDIATEPTMDEFENVDDLSVEGDEYNTLEDIATEPTMDEFEGVDDLSVEGDEFDALSELTDDEEASEEDDEDGSEDEAEDDSESNDPLDTIANELEKALAAAEADISTELDELESLDGVVEDALDELAGALGGAFGEMFEGLSELFKLDGLDEDEEEDDEEDLGSDENEADGEDSDEEEAEAEEEENDLDSDEDSDAEEEDSEDDVDEADEDLADEASEDEEAEAEEEENDLDSDEDSDAEEEDSDEADEDLVDEASEDEEEEAEDLDSDKVGDAEDDASEDDDTEADEDLADEASEDEEDESEDDLDSEVDEASDFEDEEDEETEDYDEDLADDAEDAQTEATVDASADEVTAEVNAEDDASADEVATEDAYNTSDEDDDPDNDPNGGAALDISGEDDAKEADMLPEDKVAEATEDDSYIDLFKNLRKPEETKEPEENPFSFLNYESQFAKESSEALAEENEPNEEPGDPSFIKIEAEEEEKEASEPTPSEPEQAFSPEELRSELANLFYEPVQTNTEADDYVAPEESKPTPAPAPEKKVEEDPFEAFKRALSDVYR